MKRVSAVLFGAMLAVASLVAANYQPSTHVAYGPPTPLCPPDDTSCSTGGPN